MGVRKRWETSDRFFINQKGESMTENSIPVESGTVDTSSFEPATNAAVTSETQTEPKAADITAENTGKDDLTDAKDKELKPTEKLYANKYKSIEELEKGYLEAQKFVGKAGELEKQLTAYKEQEEKAKLAREMQARSQGFSDVEEQKIMEDVVIHEFQLFAQALESGYAGDNYAAAKQALLTYQQTGNPHDLMAAKKLFSPEALEIIAENRKAFKDAKVQEYTQNKRQSLFNLAKENLESFVKATGDWINPKERQDVIGYLFNEFGGDLNLDKTKEMIEIIENGAVERYKTSLKAEQEQQARTAQMQPPTGLSDGKPNLKSSDWRLVQSEDEMKKTISKYL